MDIKPANIFVSNQDLSNANIKIGDFGSAMTTAIGDLKVGTPGYMAPDNNYGIRLVNIRCHILK